MAPRTATTDDKKKLQFSLKELGVNSISAADEVNYVHKPRNRAVHFHRPEVQTSLAANPFTVPGRAETEELPEMLPGVLSRLGAESVTGSRRWAETAGTFGGRKSTTCCWGRGSR